MKRKYKSQPEPSTDLPKVKDNYLEEFKIVAVEARTIMTRYVQMIGLYVAVIGFLAPEIIEEKSVSTNYLWLSAFTVLNVGAIIAAGRFKSMAYHYLDRMDLLAEELGFQKPHPMVWGYWIGVTLFAAIEVIVATYLIYQILQA